MKKLFTLALAIVAIGFVAVAAPAINTNQENPVAIVVNCNEALIVIDEALNSPAKMVDMNKATMVRNATTAPSNETVVNVAMKSNTMTLDTGGEVRYNVIWPQNIVITAGLYGHPWTHLFQQARKG